MATCGYEFGTALEEWNEMIDKEYLTDVRRSKKDKDILSIACKRAV
jgi:hypothetical protein